MALVCLALNLVLASTSEVDRYVSAAVVDRLPHRHRFAQRREITVVEKTLHRDGSHSEKELTVDGINAHAPAEVKAEIVAGVAAARSAPDLAVAQSDASLDKFQAALEAQRANQYLAFHMAKLAEAEHALKHTVSMERSAFEHDAANAYQERAHAEINAEKALHAAVIGAHHEVLQAEHDATVAAQEAATQHVDADRKVAESMVHAKVEKLRDEYHFALAHKESSEATEAADVAKLKAAQREMEVAQEQLDKNKALLKQLQELHAKREQELQEKRVELNEKDSKHRRAVDNFNQMQAKLEADTKKFTELAAIADASRRAYELSETNLKNHKMEREAWFTNLREETDGALKASIAQAESEYSTEVAYLKKRVEDAIIGAPDRIRIVEDSENSEFSSENQRFQDETKRIENEVTNYLNDIDGRRRSENERYEIAVRSGLTGDAARENDLQHANALQVLDDETSEINQREKENKRAADVKHRQELNSIRDKHDAERSRIRLEITTLQEETDKKLNEIKTAHDSKISAWTTDATNKKDGAMREVQAKNEVEERSVLDAKDEATARQHEADTARMIMEGDQRLINGETLRATTQELADAVREDVTKRATNLADLELQIGEQNRNYMRSVELVHILERRFKGLQLDLYRDEQQTVKDSEVAAAKNAAEKAAEAQEAAMDGESTGSNAEEAPMMTDESALPSEEEMEKAIADAEYQQEVAKEEIAEAEAKLEHSQSSIAADSEFHSHEYVDTPGANAASEALDGIVGDHNAATEPMLPKVTPVTEESPADAPPAADSVTPENAEAAALNAEAAAKASEAASNANTVEEAAAAVDLAENAANAAEIAGTPNTEGSTVADNSEIVSGKAGDLAEGNTLMGVDHEQAVKDASAANFLELQTSMKKLRRLSRKL